MDDLYIDKIVLEKSKIKDYDIYPFNIKCLKNFDNLNLTKSVTFLVGENGSGKSTILEAIALSQGLNPEGGTQNFNFKTKDTHSCLYEYLHTFGHGIRPKTKFFLRAESFYNFSSEVDRLVLEDGYNELYKSYGGSLHSCSHGEAFLKLIKNRFSDHGLYILDEPEAALSPNRQMSLLCLINELVKNGSQFIIATHSPILISYRDGEILNVDSNFQKINFEDTEIYQTYKMYLDNPYGMQIRLFDLGGD